MTATKTALVTGSTEGLGRLTARRLAAAGFRVLVHGRSRDRGESLVNEIRAARGEAVFYQADLASLEAVRGLARAIRHDTPCLALLINNAGAGTGPRGAARETSADGLELRFAVNYLAGFALTNLLLPALTAVPHSRIVNVASAAQYPLDFANVMLTRAYSGLRAYSQSKLAQVMFTFDLAETLAGSNTTVNCLHPASCMDTRMVTETGTAPLSTVEEGTTAVLHLALSAETAAETGGYFDGMRPARAHEQAYDEGARRQLRELSVTLTGIEPP